MLPALISQLGTLLKDTSLGFVVASAELLRTGHNAVEFLGGSYSIAIYTAIAVMYIAVNGSLSFLARWLDRRTQRRDGAPPSQGGRRSGLTRAADRAGRPRQPGAAVEHLLTAISGARRLPLIVPKGA